MGLFIVRPLGVFWGELLASVEHARPLPVSRSVPSPSLSPLAQAQVMDSNLSREGYADLTPVHNFIVRSPPLSAISAVSAARSLPLPHARALSLTPSHPPSLFPAPTPPTLHPSPSPHTAA